MRVKSEELLSSSSEKQLQITKTLKGKGIALETRLGAGPATRTKVSHTGNVYLVPAVFRINCSGMAFEKAMVASKPVQWAGTT